jgi:hypothetical protein
MRFTVQLVYFNTNIKNVGTILYYTRMCCKYYSTMEIRDSSITCRGFLVYSILDTRTEFLLAATENILFINKTYIFVCGCQLVVRNFDVIDVKEVKIFMYRRPILFTLFDAVDFLKVLKIAVVLGGGGGC